MATIRTAIQITDGMTPAFRSMTKAMNVTLASFEALQSASSTAIDTSSIQAARAELNRAEIAMNDIEQEIREANAAQQQFNNGVRTSSGLMDKLKSGAMALGAAFSIKKITDLADSMTSTGARLDLMNDGLQTTEELQNKIFQSAQRSRTAYTDTAAAVSKLGILAKDAFSSNEEMIAFAELMNKQFKIGGASVQEQTSAMYQLTQAMAAGKLQGDEFRSIMENAPLLAQAIAEKMGKTVGELREMSSEGLITADVIKSAMFSAADETNAKFAQLPMTFGQVTTVIGNTLLQAFEPVIQTIGKGAQWIGQNMDIVIPIVYGLAGAAGAYAAVLGIQAAAAWAAKVAQDGLNLSLLANPAIWIALAIGVLIGMIYKWVQSVGGLKIAWLIVMNAIMTAWDWVKIGFFTGIYWVLDLWDKLKLGMMTAGVGIANFMGDMKASVLMILQNMVNGAIDIINGFIETLNKIPGVSIDTINNVTFGTDAALQNEAEKQAREAGLEAYKSEIEAGMADRDASLLQMQNDAIAATATRQAEIDAAQVEALAKKDNDAAGFDYDSMINNIEDTAGNTAKMADSMDSSEEELKYLRDLAEQEVINRFTTAEIKVEMNNQNTIASNMDLDGVVTYLEDKLYETMVVAAEGVHE
jgi:tape measure domain-containing protein